LNLLIKALLPEPLHPGNNILRIVAVRVVVVDVVASFDRLSNVPPATIIGGDSSALWIKILTGAVLRVAPKTRAERLLEKSASYGPIAVATAVAAVVHTPAAIFDWINQKH
jgi:hypothetical protein